MRHPVWISLAFLLPMQAQAQFTVLDNAVVLTQNCVQLTPAQNAQRGAAWHDCTLDVTFGFSLDLTVNLGSNNGGADGIAWIMQQNGPSAPATSNGGNMGYGMYVPATNSWDPPFFNPSIVLEFDTWQNGNFGDPSYDHVALHRDGTNNHNSLDCLEGCPPNSIQASATNGNIEDGQDHDVHIEWDPATMVFRMEFDGVERINTMIDLVGDVFAGDSEVWWGFTGSTGGASNNQSFCLIELQRFMDIPGLSTNPASPIDLCLGETIAISVSADPGWDPTWEQTGTSSIGVSVPGDYVVNAVDANGCPATGVVNVGSETAPNLSSPSPVVLCDGESAILTATANPNASLDWDGTGSPTLTVNATGTHTVTATIAACVEEITVEVIAQPLPVLTLNPGNDLTLCDGENEVVTATTDIPASITWYQDGLPLAGNEQTISADGNWIIEAEANGCSGNTEVLQAEFLPLPSASIGSIPEVLCWNTTGLVYAVPESGTTIQDWMLPAGTPAPNQAGPGTYTALLVEDNGCTDEVVYFLNALPPIEFSLDAPPGACIGDSVTLSVSGNMESLEWYNGATTTAITLTADDGNGPFSVEVGLDGCTQTAATDVGWWPVPSVGNLPDSVIRCVLDPAVQWTWPAQSDPAVGWWVWSVNGLTTTGGPIWESEGEFVVRILDSMTGCADSTSVVVDVLPNLDVDAAPYLGVVCWGESTEVLAEVRAVEGTDIDELPYTLTWSDPSVEGLNPTVPAGTYLLEVENACGRDAALVEVTQEYCGCDMWVPTAFTPDNDGINDGYRVETNCPELDEFLLQVYDRWGELVWSTDNPDQPWAGQGLDGPAMEGKHFIPDGIYGYRLYWKYGELGVPIVEERRGHIHVLR